MSDERWWTQTELEAIMKRANIVTRHGAVTILQSEFEAGLDEAWEARPKPARNQCERGHWKNRWENSCGICREDDESETTRNIFQVGDRARLDSVSGIAWSQDKPKVGDVFQVTSVESGGDWLALKGLSELWSASRFTKVTQDVTEGEKK